MTEHRGAAPFHVPVLGNEVVRLLAPVAGRLYLDGTVGGGGHAQLILAASDGSRLLACDRDPAAIRESANRLAKFGGRARVVLSNFADVAEDEEVRRSGLGGALLDLGVSSRQLDAAARGFAYGRSVPLDMRMDAESSPEGETETAAAYLARHTRAQLARLFRDYGEVARAGTLATAVLRRSRNGRMETSDDLVAAVRASLGRRPSVREKARVFQAVRIAVNDELGSLRRGLEAIRDVLLAGAAFVVISYHSLEDREVKRRFRLWSGECSCPPDLPKCVCNRMAHGETLTRRPLRPTSAELDRNPRSRSARLRAWRRAA